MSTLVVTVDPQTPLDEVDVLLLEYGFGALPVIDGGHRLVGIVGDEEVRPATSARPGPRHDAARPHTAADVMRTDVVTVTPATTLTELVGLVRTTGRHSFPVLVEGDLVGIVARRDVADALRSLPARQRAAVLAAGRPAREDAA